MNFQQLRSIHEAARRTFNLTEVANALFTSQRASAANDRAMSVEAATGV